jgi:hypothetical protein
VADLSDIGPRQEPDPYMPDFREGEPTPDGFRLVVVPFTEAEFHRFRRKSWVTGPGTAWAAIRQGLGLGEAPHGIKKSLQRQREAAKASVKNP